MSEFFPEPNSLGGRMKSELDLSNYATKSEIKKNVTRTLLKKRRF